MRQPYPHYSVPQTDWKKIVVKLLALFHIVTGVIILLLGLSMVFGGQLALQVEEIFTNIMGVILVAIGVVFFFVGLFWTILGFLMWAESKGAYMVAWAFTTISLIIAGYGFVDLGTSWTQLVAPAVLFVLFWLGYGYFKVQYGYPEQRYMRPYGASNQFSYRDYRDLSGRQGARRGRY